MSEVRSNGFVGLDFRSHEPIDTPAMTAGAESRQAIDIAKMTTPAPGKPQINALTTMLDTTPNIVEIDMASGRSPETAAIASTGSKSVRKAAAKEPATVTSIAATMGTLE